MAGKFPFEKFKKADDEKAEAKAGVKDNEKAEAKGKTGGFKKAFEKKFGKK